MNKIIFSLVFCFISTIFYSQNYKGYYITNDDDTITCSFDIPVILFDSKKFDPQTVRNKINVITENGEKLKFKPNQIKSFFIKETKNGNYNFVSIIDQNYFYHEIIRGKLSYYKVYLNNSGGVLGYYASVKYFIIKDNNLTELNSMNLKKGLSKQIKDYPELDQKWMDSSNYYKVNQIEEVIELYNEHFK
ncbi:hypothetical protein KHA90_04355 [Flavobacterium psychroterrae]|uniref:DUF4468 domain-containing protein n=1 Tax=Flavobacterium psychroterrae TaxID=2133767 RepID=A0ABS5P7G0_9FLAO|nr:hypothetical protein [Flavobacterium psychroterrae]MBS7230248.1 hypothetical protein [Flavobacterium psychroterrae]